MQVRFVPLFGAITMLDCIAAAISCHRGSAGVLQRKVEAYFVCLVSSPNKMKCSDKHSITDNSVHSGDILDVPYVCMDVYFR